MKAHYDIAVIGAGPAGMAAAIIASGNGASVALFDEQAAAGGQIYRSITRQRLADQGVLGEEYYQGLELVEKLGASGVDHIAGATVWQVSTDREIGVSKAGASSLLMADQIIIATGAMERAFPVSGWTLPGVMGAGAAQVLLKSSGVLMPDAVFAGTGPLLYLVAHQYMRAGGAIRAVLDTTPRGNYLRALPHLPAALSQIGVIFKGQRWIRELRAAGIPFVRGVQDVRCVGIAVLEAVEYRKGKRWTRVETDHLLLHQGVVPNANLAMAAGCKHIWNDAQLCWHAQTGDWYESDIAGIAVTGDGAAISGAVAARMSGEIAALGAVCRGGFITDEERNKQAAETRRALAAETRLRPFLDALFKPQQTFRAPVDDATIVCRCEEVTAGEIRDAAQLGCGDTNQLKQHTRCGMGPCQGRLCSLTASEILAQENGKPIAHLAPPRQRAVAKPLLLGELAALCDAPVDGG